MPQFTDRHDQPLAVGDKGTYFFGSSLHSGIVERIIQLVPHPRSPNLLCREDQLNRQNPTAFPTAADPQKHYMAFMRPLGTGYPHYGVARTVPAHHLIVQEG
jgi:hypothetical protein